MINVPLPLSVWTEVARKVLVNRLAVPYRVWLIGKSIDYCEGGSGVLGTEEILHECSLYGLNESHVIRALDAVLYSPFQDL